MRLTETEKKVLIDAVHAHDPSASVWLFGSRVDDQKKGGDIDVAIQSKRIGIMEKILIKRVVTDALGEQKIDINHFSGWGRSFFSSCHGKRSAY